MKRDIWGLIIRDLKRDFKKGKDPECLLDFAFAQFYFDAMFDNPAPVQEGREFCKVFLELLKSQHQKQA